MFFDSDIRANHLPPKTICLTYDDGPGEISRDGAGPRTRELARYLFENQIRAAFFVVGSEARSRTQLLSQMAGWGHIVGNHTDHHPGLVRMAFDGGDLVREVVETESVLGSYCPASVRFLRAPYGSWRETHRSNFGAQGLPSIVAQQLNRVTTLANYVGHIHWDICPCDYDFWRVGALAKECADHCLDVIRGTGQGIILLHDSSEDPAQRILNRTFEVTQRIVPVLKAEGFTFVALDQIPQIHSAVDTRRLATFQLADGRTLGLTPDEALCFDHASPDHADQWGMVPFADDEWLLRAPNGCYLAARDAASEQYSATSLSPFDRKNVRVRVAPDGKAVLHSSGIRSSHLRQDGTQAADLRTLRANVV